MRLTKFTHACVRLEHDGRILLIDPGVWAESEAYDGVSDILVTHEHFDHVDTERLATIHTLNPGLTVYASAGAAAKLEALGDSVRTVWPRESLSINGFAVDVVGGQHAEIYNGLPGCDNVGYIVDGQVYHPGDALHVPAVRVPTVLSPVAAPWLKLAELIDFVRACSPERAIGIHDAMLSEIGQQGVENWVRGQGGTEYVRLAPGTTVEL